MPAALSGCVLSNAVPSKKLTVPVGAPEVNGVTVAVKVTVVPAFGFRLVETSRTLVLAGAE